MKVVAIDPGIDGTGVAVFQLQPPVGMGMLERLRHLESWHLIKTSSRDPLVLRLEQLSLQTAAAAAGADLVIVERPAIAGLYSRNQRAGFKQMAVPLAKLWMATGAIVAGCVRYTPTVLLPATSEPKVRRHQMLQRLFAAAKRADLADLHQPDVLDAIWLGLVQLDAAVHPTARSSK